MFIKGEVDCFDVIDMYDFTMLDVYTMMRKLKYDEVVIICHHFLMPIIDMSNGLITLEDDEYIIFMFHFVTYKEIKTYTKHDISYEYGVLD